MMEMSRTTLMSDTPQPEVLYRFEVRGSVVRRLVFYDLKPTPCGHWVKNWVCGSRSDAPPSSQDAPGCVWRAGGVLDKPKWVSKTSAKRYAYPTEDEAWYSFQRRARRWVELLEMQLHSARAVQRFSESPWPSAAANSYEVPGYHKGYPGGVLLSIHEPYHGDARGRKARWPSCREVQGRTGERDNRVCRAQGCRGK